MTATTRSRLIKVTLWLVAVILVALLLRWLGFWLWQYDEAAPLPARAADLELVLDPLGSRDLENGLSMTAFSNGSHTLTIESSDAAGNTATSPAVMVTVSNSTGGGLIA